MVETVPTVLEGFAVESPVEVCQAEVEDLDRLHVVDREIFGELAYPYFVLRQLFDAHRGEMLIARIGGQICGYSLTMTSWTSEVAWFQGLGVLREFRGHRIGRLLAVEALRLLSERGIQQVRLAVREKNTNAIALYESLGFRRISEKPAKVDYFGPGEDRELMKCVLDPAIVESWSVALAPLAPTPLAPTPVEPIPAEVGLVEVERATAHSTRH